MPFPLPPTVLAPVDFLDPLLSEKPYSCLGAPPPNMASTNIKPYPVEVEITDLRGVGGYLEEYKVETSGFQVGRVREREGYLGIGEGGALTALEGVADCRARERRAGWN